MDKLRSRTSTTGEENGVRDSTTVSYINTWIKDGHEILNVLYVIIHAPRKVPTIREERRSTRLIPTLSYPCIKNEEYPRTNPKSSQSLQSERKTATRFQPKHQDGQFTNPDFPQSEIYREGDAYGNEILTVLFIKDDGECGSTHPKFPETDKSTREIVTLSCIRFINGQFTYLVRKVFTS
ncbi:hypothetical protein BJ508DRAFT_303627 [Ascobolus immersus RN42]|uniref:Uncharacterized protein n=1 Tax=Ascobolus immersus RN42 TaxID=1160509 RepID=A0A3N4IFX0_ASCIM|nr:hypothetical protein BJ508DRAFT_303627 [Ascobolus immersus RN42]